MFERGEVASALATAQRAGETVAEVEEKISQLEKNIAGQRAIVAGARSVSDPARIVDAIALGAALEVCLAGARLELDAARVEQVRAGNKSVDLLVELVKVERSIAGVRARLAEGVGLTADWATRFETELRTLLNRRAELSGS